MVDGLAAWSSWGVILLLPLFKTVSFCVDVVVFGVAVVFKVVTVVVEAAVVGALVLVGAVN